MKKILGFLSSAIFLLAFLFIIELSFAEKIYLKSGVEVEGEILEQGKDYIYIRSSMGDLSFYIDDIDRVEPPLVIKAPEALAFGAENSAAPQPTPLPIPQELVAPFEPTVDFEEIFTRVRAISPEKDPFLEAHIDFIKKTGSKYLANHLLETLDDFMPEHDKPIHLLSKFHFNADLKKIQEEGRITENEYVEFMRFLVEVDKDILAGRVVYSYLKGDSGNSWFLSADTQMKLLSEFILKENTKLSKLSLIERFKNFKNQGTQAVPFLIEVYRQDSGKFRGLILRDLAEYNPGSEYEYFVDDIVADLAQQKFDAKKYFDARFEGNYYVDALRSIGSPRALEEAHLLEAKLAKEMKQDVKVHKAWNYGKFIISMCPFLFFGSLFFLANKEFSVGRLFYIFYFVYPTLLSLFFIFNNVMISQWMKYPNLTIIFGTIERDGLHFIGQIIMIVLVVLANKAVLKKREAPEFSERQDALKIWKILLIWILVPISFMAIGAFLGDLLFQPKAPGSWAGIILAVYAGVTLKAAFLISAFNLRYLDGRLNNHVELLLHCGKVYVIGFVASIVLSHTPFLLLITFI